MGATAANILITLDNCDARTLLNQAHCSAFAAGAGTYYYGIVIVGMWHGRAYLSIHKSNRMVTFIAGKPIDSRYLSGYILSGLCFVCFLLLPYVLLDFYRRYSPFKRQVSAYVKEPAKELQ
ncbi:hypothetical protein ACLK1T_10645 [Escherichia coli]